MMALIEALLDPVVLKVGLTCLVSQLVLTFLFDRVLPKGRPWTFLPGFTAHQLVAFPLMVYFTYQGFYQWFSIDIDPTEEKVLTYRDDVGRNLAACALGVMAYWDIPMGFLVPQLRDPVMWAHHFGMSWIACVILGVFSGKQPVGEYYSLFFLGVIEGSSIPLVVVDVFHPKHGPFYPELAMQNAFWKNINEISRVSFAIVYLILRAFYFPYVVATEVVPDFWAAANQDNAPRGTLYGVIIASILFTLLQIHWGTLIVRQLEKALLGDKKDKKKTE